WQPEEEVPEPEGATESSAEEAALESIGRRSMLELIENLSHEQKQVLTLKFVFNFSNGEAAAILGKTEAAVKSLQHRALVSVQTQAKSGDPKLKEEVAELERVLAHLDLEQPLSDYPAALPAELEPLTTKPLVVIENGPGGIDLKLEAELAELPAHEAAEFRDGPSALESVLREVFEAAEVLTFFTASEKEARAWTLRRGATAVEAAAAVHSDLARGFVRCEVIRWNDLVESGSRAEVARRGLQRVEGKTYVVEDGDVLNVRSSL